jgi:SNF2 family DNA or RNA helicase
VGVQVVIKCTLSALQKIQYRQLSYATLRTRDEKGNLKTTAYNNTIMRLRQVCNHPYLMDDNESQWDLGAGMRVRSCGKLDVLDRILPKLKMAGHRVLIYSQMVQLLEILAEYIEEQGYKYNKLVGATSSDVRAKMIEDFNRPDSDTFLFILSTRAGGQGVNLQTADTVIIFDSDWNPMMDEQVAPPLPRASLHPTPTPDPAAALRASRP